MNVTQVYALVNQALGETTGKTNVLNEDLSNVVDAGQTLAELDDGNGKIYDNYVKKLMNQVGKFVMVDRNFGLVAPSVMRDAWEFGSICEKISGEIPDAEVSEDWKMSTHDGQVVSPFWVKLPNGINVKFFNGRITFTIKQTFPHKQIKESFQNAEQLNRFVSMLEGLIRKGLTKADNNLIKMAINNMTAHTINANKANYINLWTSFAEAYPTLAATFSAGDEGRLIKTPEFIRNSIYEMSLISRRLQDISVIYNTGEKQRFTPREFQNWFLLDAFAEAAGVYLYDGQGQFRTDNILLPSADILSYWQGTGTSYAFSDISSLNIKTTDGDTVTASNILGVCADREAVVVANLNNETRTMYNPEIDGTNMWYEQTMGLINDDDENYVVFGVTIPSGT